jgi:hypothetical protein
MSYLSIILSALCCVLYVFKARKFVVVVARIETHLANTTFWNRNIIAFIIDIILKFCFSNYYRNIDGKINYV